MNLQDIKYEVRRFFDRFEPAQMRRFKLIAACVMLALAALLIVGRIVATSPQNKPKLDLTSPGVTLTQELNEALLKKPAFAETVFRLYSEDPIKLRLVGTVKSARDLEALKQYIRELKPDAPPDQFEFAVDVVE